MFLLLPLQFSAAALLVTGYGGSLFFDPDASLKRHVAAIVEKTEKKAVVEINPSEKKITSRKGKNRKKGKSKGFGNK